ncbi:MAG TPA: SEC-C metal-binding domain-containing protein [Thermoanaerobaculia bacterium]
MAFAPRQVRKREPGHPIILRSLSFDPRKAMPKSLIREIRKHRWPVAGAAAYPMLLSFDAEMEQFRATERDFRIMTACTHAFLSFFERHGDIFDIDEPEQTLEVFTADDGVTVTLTAPHPELDVLEDDEGELSDDELLEPPVAVGPNDPCPCGSGKKYKKCHLDADRE